MFPMDGARLQVKKEADECSIEMPACSEVRPENLMSSYPDFSDSRRWDTAAGAREPSLDVNKDGGARPLIATGSMTLKFSGSGNLEAYLAQFELLAAAAGWSGQMKAVQLALSLTEEAAACLLLLSPDERQDYAMLVGALQRRFGVLNLKDSLRCEFKNRVRRPGESLRSLAHEIESLGRRAYSTLPSVIQSELVRDQFVHALTPVELRLHVQLIHPVSLSQALELALERETAFGASKCTELMVTAATKVEPEYKPAWAEELIHAVKNLAVRPRGADTQSPSNLPPSCWGCGKPGHTLRRCPEAKANVPRQECLVYLDDVLVHGKSFRAALDSLRLVLGRIATAGLKLHPDKCHFMRREVEFLGHKVDEGQVARWLEELQLFHFEIVHRPGTQHANADALSRRPCASTGCGYCDRRDAREEELRGEAAVAEPACCSVEVEGSPDWASEQGKDSDLRPVRQWVIRGERPSWEGVMGLSVATKSLWSKFKTLRVLEGVLQRGWKEPATGEERWQIVVPKALRDGVLGACHGGAGSGHFGTTKTLYRLRQEYYWGQHRRDVEDFCRRCDECAAYKGPQDQSHAPLQQQAVGAPMERVAVDIMGPFPVSDQGNKYVMCAMDYFTKWPEAYALPDQEAETVADTLLEGMFSRFGTPDIIHSDQGRNFESRVFAALCDRLNLQKTCTTPLHPQSDGLVERLNRTMQQQLAILTAAHQRDWDKHIPLVLMAYRSAVQNSTNCTPALLMLGREIRTPAALAYGRPPGDLEDVPGPEYARKLQDRMESAHAFARDQLEKAGMRQKRNYDVRSKGKDFSTGDLVWVYTPKRKKGRCPKLDSHWDGPCRVLEQVGEVVYRVQVPPRGRKFRSSLVLGPSCTGPTRSRTHPLQNPPAPEPTRSRTHPLQNPPRSRTHPLQNPPTPEPTLQNPPPLQNPPAPEPTRSRTHPLQNPPAPEPTRSRTHPAPEPTRSRTHPLQNPPAPEPTRSRTHPLQNPPRSRTHPLQNPPAPEPTRSRTHPLQNPPAPEPTHSRTHPLQNPPAPEPTRSRTHPLQNPPIQNPPAPEHTVLLKSQRRCLSSQISVEQEEEESLKQEEEESLKQEEEESLKQEEEEVSIKQEEEESLKQEEEEESPKQEEEESPKQEEEESLKQEEEEESPKQEEEESPKQEEEEVSIKQEEEEVSIKQEEELSIKQEEEQLPEFTAVCVKSEEQAPLIQDGVLFK
uniref:Gypsy retrotransposon integrase-like protein 1 n=1 Tax=Knipowitschia caucasica TaxID=637954 RepID=A0AAV2KTQ3_KNICA